MFEEAHGANLLILPSGEIMCAWFSGNEGKNGVAIVTSRLHPGAMGWTEPTMVEGGFDFGYAVRGWIYLPSPCVCIVYRRLLPRFSLYVP